MLVMMWAVALYPSACPGAGYDPLQTVKRKPEQQELIVGDAKRSRDIPIRVYLPGAKTPAPVVLFSHGLGGTRAGSEYLGIHWALRGYVAVFLQHPGSDDSAWRDAPPAQRMAAMQKAASLQNFLLRVRDVPVVLDQLERWNRPDSGHLLARRLDMKRVGMAGHSFGAITTQAVSGQAFPVGAGYTDARIRAAVLMSPSGPRRGNQKEAFGNVKIPWMLLTGTEDTALIGQADAESRLAVFPALPPGRKYELVLYKAEHSAFTDRRLPGDREKRNPNHHRAILAVTTAFWDACLRDKAEARTWLDGEKARSVLEKEDRWQKK